MNNCKICGAPCRNKYCEEHRKEAYRKKRNEREKQKGKGIKPLKFHGCNEDCFNCPYPDCKKPAGKFKTDRTVIEAKPKSTESAPRMYTLELGGFGGINPNISRKFYV